MVDDAFAAELRRRMKVAAAYYGTEEEREGYLASRARVDTVSYEQAARVPVPFQDKIDRWLPGVRN